MQIMKSIRYSSSWEHLTKTALNRKKLSKKDLRMNMTLLICADIATHYNLV